MFRHDSPEEVAFRTEVRTWLEASLPTSLRGRTSRPPPDALMPRYGTLSRKGWIAPDWPKLYGGLGATLNRQIIMTEELVVVRDRFPRPAGGARRHGQKLSGRSRRGAAAKEPAASNQEKP